ncbi:hypothetical protein [Kineosporia babensis]|uniref:Secreted protein n=1 Tax=Kineosporia babensis TaxID=499548 RepID=A0A9X1NCJ4_9ACTN|nr:hypothetical protein [Kineosporia babensis]MCD5310761.1 hypothetical protein [Kineosporia babensis]
MSTLKRSVALTATTGLAALSFTLGNPLSASAAPIETQAKQKATKIVALSPFRPSGALKKAWQTDARPRDSASENGLDCSDGSSPAWALNDGMYQCPPSLLGADACWSSPKYVGQLLCLESPWSRSLNHHQVRVLPAKSKALKRPQPLALELTDGSQWLLKTSGTRSGRKDGLLGIYTCVNKVCSEKTTGKNLAVLSAGGHGVNRSKPLWSVRVGEVGDGDVAYPAPKRYKVKKAWFIHNNIK